MRAANSPTGTSMRPDVGDHHEQRRARRVRDAEAPRGGDELAGIPERDARRERQHVAGEDRGDTGQPRPDRAAGSVLTPSSPAGTRPRGRPARQQRPHLLGRERALAARPRGRARRSRVSSETTSTSASVSSESPSAARCRVPSDAVADRILGERQDAPRADDLVAPHEHGAVVQRRVGAEDRGEQVGGDGGPHARVPDSRYSSSRTSRSTAMMAPVALRLSRSTALRDLFRHRRARPGAANRRKTGVCPSRASACRSSGWNTTSAANDAVGEYHAEQVGDHRELEQERGEVDDGQDQQPEDDLEGAGADQEPEQRVERRTRR